jgi:hypothetical protein
MSTSYIAPALRREVVARSEGLCEYCLIHENDTFFGCEVDHIVSEKHGGATQEENLAYACFFCNRAKGSDLGSLASGTDILVRFFSPRRDLWSEHFVLSQDGVTIRSLSDVGEVTERILGFNQPDRLLEREALRIAGSYPSPAALRRMQVASA